MGLCCLHERIASDVHRGWSVRAAGRPCGCRPPVRRQWQDRRSTKRRCRASWNRAHRAAGCAHRRGLSCGANGRRAASWLFLRTQPDGLGRLVRPGADGRSLAGRAGWRNDEWADSARRQADLWDRRRRQFSRLFSRRGDGFAAGGRPVWFQRTWRNPHSQQFVHSRPRRSDRRGRAACRRFAWRGAGRRHFARRRDGRRRFGWRGVCSRDFAWRRAGRRCYSHHQRPWRTTSLRQAGGGVPPEK